MLGEYNTFVKDLRNIDIKFGLIYPNSYSVGMSSYSIRFLYSYLNSFENIACERVFLPQKIKYPASKDYQSIDIIRSLENHLLPRDFDILGFSIQFENDFRNILWILEKSGIPLSRTERCDSSKHDEFYYPLIIGGGPVATSNPLPLSKIFDIFFIGDAEPNLDVFLQYFMNFKFDTQNINKLYKDLKKINGIYIPHLKNETKRVFVKDLNDSSIPIYQIMAKEKDSASGFQDAYFVEINRGCPYQCKFCISSHHNRPFRNRSFTKIKQILIEAVRELDIEKISLIGSCVSSHPQFLEICECIIKLEKNLSIPSIRIDHITSKTIEVLERGNIKTITIAPESGSEKLRFELGKRITDDQLFDIVLKIRESEIRNIKMYFLVGLPNESENEIIDTINFINKLERSGFSKDSIRISINPLIPKLNTPYEKKVDYYFENDLSNLNEKLAKIKDELKDLFSVKLKIGDTNNIVKNARLQTLFSLGDETVSDLLLEYYSNGANLGALRRAEKMLNFSINEYFQKIHNCFNPWTF
ncbi:MAG: hypothetical protein BAJALOKI3v1_670013 [Promethearchaeota archaeon]|nr:MAG: hypothetical protein BAJALOKI3v1_670013 [Candidatus Lokiarchaeota archaeon]